MARDSRLLRIPALELALGGTEMGDLDSRTAHAVLQSVWCCSIVAALLAAVGSRFLEQEYDFSTLGEFAYAALASLRAVVRGCRLSIVAKL